MARGKNDHPGAGNAAGRHGRSSPKWLLPMKVIEKQLRKKMVKLRKEVNLMEELLEMDRAEVEEMERECARRRKWNDLASKENSSIHRGIEITLEIIDAEDECDPVKVNELRQSLRELVADHIEGKVALLTGRQD